MKKIPKNIPSGVYKHYKGKYYLVLGLAHHSETMEKFIVYVPLYVMEGPRMCIRPAEMFFEKVIVGNKKVPRFKYIGREYQSK